MPSPAERRLLYALLVAVTLACGSDDAPCHDDDDCGSGQFCSALGRCNAQLRAPVLTLESPQVVHYGAPGAALPVRGLARFVGTSAQLQVKVTQGALTVFDVTTVTLPGDRLREVEVAFELSSLTMPEGDGQLRLILSVGPTRVELMRALISHTRCPGCPVVQVSSPTAGALPTRQLFARLQGAVARLDGGLASVATAGDLGGESVTPLLLAPGGHFEDVLLPLDLGRNEITVSAVNEVGVDARRLEVFTEVPPEDLLVVGLGWQSVEADLDLVLVPPDRVYGPGVCAATGSAAARPEDCISSGDAFALGPETLSVPAQGRAGTWGVMVIGFSAPVDTLAPAHVRVVSRGRQLGAVGPRALSPARAEVWLVGTARVGEDGAPGTFTLLDLIADAIPACAPEGWPDCAERSR